MFFVVLSHYGSKMVAVRGWGGEAGERPSGFAFLIIPQHTHAFIKINISTAPLRLFRDSVSIYSSAYPYERGTPKKRMMEFVLYPPLYTKKTKRTIGDGVK
jgi:hypothetical protein